jgi:hypothetical protein
LLTPPAGAALGEATEEDELALDELAGLLTAEAATDMYDWIADIVSVPLTH